MRMDGGGDERPRVVVCQSDARTRPAWRQECLETVSAWARSKDYAYIFETDEFFTRVPGWYRDRVQAQSQLMADLARLLLLREVLEGGAEVAVWIDADVVVMQAGRFDPVPSTSFAFTRELWLEPRAEDGVLQLVNKVNNSVCAFRSSSQGRESLDRFIAAAIGTVHSRGRINRLDVSTNYLTDLHHRLPFELFLDVGIVPPPLAEELVAGGGPLARRYLQFFAIPMAAANLCGSMVDDSGYDSRRISGATAEALVRLLRTGGLQGAGKTGESRLRSRGAEEELA